MSYIIILEVNPYQMLAIPEDKSVILLKDPVEYPETSKELQQLLEELDNLKNDSSTNIIKCRDDLKDALQEGSYYFNAFADALYYGAQKICIQGGILDELYQKEVTSSGEKDS